MTLLKHLVDNNSKIVKINRSNPTELPLLRRHHLHHHPHLLIDENNINPIRMTKLKQKVGKRMTMKTMRRGDRRLYHDSYLLPLPM